MWSTEICACLGLRVVWDMHTSSFRNPLLRQVCSGAYWDEINLKNVIHTGMLPGVTRTTTTTAPAAAVAATATVTPHGHQQANAHSKPNIPFGGHPLTLIYACVVLLLRLLIYLLYSLASSVFDRFQHCAY